MHRISECDQNLIARVAALTRSGGLCRQETGQALAVAKAADDTYREAMEQGLGDKDFCAVHSTVKGKK